MDDPVLDPVAQVAAARKLIGEKFLRGVGIEVGAGDRPFPAGDAASVLYGDIRDDTSLQQYFKSAPISPGAKIDAQTFSGIADGSVDFVISAHVIEHLRNPIGSIVNAVRVLRPGGIHALVVPDLRFTFDRRRPGTTVDHSLRDYEDGGEGTCRQAYEEHLRYVHPELTGEVYSEEQIQWQATQSAIHWQECDIHFHAWTREQFEALLAGAAQLAPFAVEETVSVVNENIFVLRKLRC